MSNSKTTQDVVIKIFNQPKMELVDEPEDVKEAFVTESMKIQSPRLMLVLKIKHYKKRLKISDLNVLF